LENTVRDLDSTKSSLVEKDRIIKQRDALLESHALELRKMGEMLDKERQGHRNVKHQFETFQKTHQHVTRTVSSQDQRIIELEQAKSQDKKRLSQLENTFKDQLTERNNLLLVLWTRLSALCGTDWAHDNSLINGRALPSLEAVATMLPGFSKNLLAAIKTIETMVGSFQGKVKSVEKDLWREYQTLENHLDQRTKKLERLETIVRNGIASGQLSPHSHTLSEAQARVARLEDAYRQLKVENHTLRAAADARRAAYAEHNGLASPDGSPSPSVPMGPTAKNRSASSSKIPKSGSRSSLSRPVSVSTPSRSSSQHYFHQHHSRQNLAVSSQEDMARARSRGNSPATPSRGGGGGGGAAAPEDDDTLTVATPTQASHHAQSQGQGPGHDRGERERERERGRDRSANPAISSNSTALSTTTATSNQPPPALPTGGSNVSSGGAGGPVVDNKWMLRLRDLEYKLKAEREGRILDRGEAMKRIHASEDENAVLRGDLERERDRRRGR
jgi:hypothetical protein